MELKPGYQQTEIGVLPEDWSIKKLGNGLSSHPAYGINAPACSYAKGLPTYIRITDITDEGRYIPEAYVRCTSDEYFLEKGDIVLARTGASVGKSYIYRETDGRLVYAGFLIRIHPDGINFDPQFVFYCLHTDVYWKWVASTSMRSGQPGINSQEYSSLILPCPTISEQKAIAAALSDVDALLDSLDALIAKKRDMKKAAMQELLTGKTRLPGFGGEWVSIETSQIGNYKAGNVFPERYQGKTITEVAIPFFKVSDLNSHNKLLTISNNYITKDDAKEIRASIIPQRSIVFAKIGAAIFLERKRLLTQDSYIDNNMCAFLCSKNVDYRFVYYKFIDFKFGELVSTTALPALNSNDLNSINFFMPIDLSEQQAIVNVLSDMDTELEALEARYAKVKGIKTGMMQELLTGKTRLVPTGEQHG